MGAGGFGEMKLKSINEPFVSGSHLFKSVH